MLPDKISWYPGHMTKAMRAMQEDIKKVDLVIELLDARIPVSSENPDIDTLAKNKFRMVLLNKADLADEEETARWIKSFEARGIMAFSLDSRNTKRMAEIKNAIPTVCKEKIERDRRRGIMNRPVRAMVAGVWSPVCRTSGNPPLPIPSPEKPLPKQAISPVLPKEISGSD